jgi:hypothetical protein
MQIVFFTAAALVFGWMIWVMLFRKTHSSQQYSPFKLWHILWPPMIFQHLLNFSDSKPIGDKKPTRQKILFVLFLLVVIVGFFFDPFRKFK